MGDRYVHPSGSRSTSSCTAHTKRSEPVQECFGRWELESERIGLPLQKRHTRRRAEKNQGQGRERETRRSEHLHARRSAVRSFDHENGSRREQSLGKDLLLA